MNTNSLIHPIEHRKNFSYINNNTCGGFTLAETLITLTVIGVIATLTIPGMMQGYKSYQLETADKKMRATMMNGFRMMKVNNESFASFTSTEDFISNMQKEFKIAQTCDSNNLTNCFVSEFSTSDEVIRTSSLKTSKKLGQDWEPVSDTGAVKLVDGTSILLSYNKNCAEVPSEYQTDRCVSAIYDLGIGKSSRKYEGENGKGSIGLFNATLGPQELNCGFIIAEGDAISGGYIAFAEGEDYDNDECKTKLTNDCIAKLLEINPALFVSHQAECYSHTPIGWAEERW